MDFASFPITTSVVQEPEDGYLRETAEEELFIGIARLVEPNPGSFGMSVPIPNQR
jgi:hypothetical protein